jgi:excisionase family DNA binding protein
MHFDAAANDTCLDLVSRARLIRRWRHGSAAFLWRAGERGLLRPVRDGAILRYRWTDVFIFEGGLPPPGMTAAYTEDLWTENEVAALCHCTVGTIRRRAKQGCLPFRRVGRVIRFVPAEVGDWLGRWVRA